jgi:hypothetical protein
LSYWYSLKNWIRTSGKPIFTEEQYLMDCALERLFGYFVVQLERLGDNHMLTNSRINHKLILSSDVGVFKSERSHNEFPVVSDLDYIPIGKETVDVFVLPHTLEMAHDPLYLLRQIDSMLIPEGHIVLTGFNPVGSYVLFKRWLSRSKVFAEGNLESANRIKGWLKVLGYEIVSVEYTPTLFFKDRNDSTRPRWLSWLQTLLHKFGFGNVYCMVAKKKVDAPKLVGMRWRMAPWRRIGARMPASNRSKVAKLNRSQHD